MQISKFLPVPLMVAVAAFVFMWLTTRTPLLALSWVAFITWGGYFLSGISTKSAVEEAISVTLGIGLGALIVTVATPVSSVLGETFTFPVIVAVAAFFIVLLELVPWFDMAPGYFLGAAALFAALGIKPTATLLDNSIAVWVPAMAGLLLGVLTGYLRGVIFGLEKVRDPKKK